MELFPHSTLPLLSCSTAVSKKKKTKIEKKQKDAKTGLGKQEIYWKEVSVKVKGQGAQK